MLGTPQNEPYQDLVQQLMRYGWYRIGQGPAHDRDRVMWGFREGHVIDHADRQSLWIPARDELSAMHLLLKEIERLRSSGGSPGTPATPPSPTPPWPQGRVMTPPRISTPSSRGRFEVELERPDCAVPCGMMEDHRTGT